MTDRPKLYPLYSGSAGTEREFVLESISLWETQLRQATREIALLRRRLETLDAEASPPCR